MAGEDDDRSWRITGRAAELFDDVLDERGPDSQSGPKL
jgi:hypothetical protein